MVVHLVGHAPRGLRPLGGGVPRLGGAGGCARRRLGRVEVERASVVGPGGLGRGIDLRVLRVDAHVLEVLAVDLVHLRVEQRLFLLLPDEDEEDGAHAAPEQQEDDDNGRDRTPGQAVVRRRRDLGEGDLAPLLRGEPRGCLQAYAPKRREDTWVGADEAVVEEGAAADGGHRVAHLGRRPHLCLHGNRHDRLDRARRHRVQPHHRLGVEEREVDPLALQRLEVSLDLSLAIVGRALGVELGRQRFLVVVVGHQLERVGLAEGGDEGFLESSVGAGQVEVELVDPHHGDFPRPHVLPALAVPCAGGGNARGGGGLRRVGQRPHLARHHSGVARPVPDRVAERVLARDNRVDELLAGLGERAVEGPVQAVDHRDVRHPGNAPVVRTVRHLDALALRGGVADGGRGRVRDDDDHGGRA